MKKDGLDGLSGIAIEFKPEAGRYIIELDRKSEKMFESQFKFKNQPGENNKLLAAKALLLKTGVPADAIREILKDAEDPAPKEVGLTFSLTLSALRPEDFSGEKRRELRIDLGKSLSLSPKSISIDNVKAGSAIVEVTARVESRSAARVRLHRRCPCLCCRARNQILACLRAR